MPQFPGPLTLFAALGFSNFVPGPHLQYSPLQFWAGKVADTVIHAATQQPVVVKLDPESCPAPPKAIECEPCVCESSGFGWATVACVSALSVASGAGAATLRRPAAVEEAAEEPAEEQEEEEVEEPVVRRGPLTRRQRQERRTDAA